MNTKDLKPRDKVIISMSELLAERPYYEGPMYKGGDSIIGIYERDCESGSLKIIPLPKFIEKGIIKANSGGYIWVKPHHITGIIKDEPVYEELGIEKYSGILEGNAQIKQAIHSDDLVSVL